jgi:hypothetical protein
MILGILSDSHGHPRPVRAAVELFDRLGVEHIIHCGDIGGVEVLDELVGHSCTMVWGNTDVVDGAVLAFLQAADLPAPAPGPASLTLAGNSIAVFHGHERGFEAACALMRLDYIFHGHTHQWRDERIGKTRIINPGALHRTRMKTVATLDLDTDQVTFHTIVCG